MTEFKVSGKLVYQERHTKSTIFILPMLGNSLESYSNNFLNCYIGDKNKPEHEDKIVLLFVFKGDIEFGNFENYLRNIKGYTTDYEPVKGFVCFVYDIPDLYYMDYLRFIRGKYSSFSKELRDIITGKIEDGLIAKVFAKDPLIKEHWEKKIGIRLKDTDEVYPIPDMEEEILDYEKHFKKEN